MGWGGVASDSDDGVAVMAMTVGTVTVVVIEVVVIVNTVCMAAVVVVGQADKTKKGADQDRHLRADHQVSDARQRMSSLHP